MSILILIKVITIITYFVKFKNKENQQTITNLNVLNGNYFRDNLKLIFEASNGMAEIKKCDLNTKF